MDDLISRQAVINVIDKIFPAEPMLNDYTQGITCGAALAKTYIEQLPSAQPEIIRCKDCKHRDDDFCDKGERRSKNQMYESPITVLVGPKEGLEARKKAMEEFYESYMSSDSIPLAEHVKDAIAKKMADEEKIITDYIELSCEKALCLVIDKGELKKALLYDRRQYEKGYADGYAQGKKEVNEND